VLAEPPSGLAQAGFGRTERAAFRLVLEQRNENLNDRALTSRDASMIITAGSEHGPGGIQVSCPASSNTGPVYGGVSARSAILSMTSPLGGGEWAEEALEALPIQVMRGGEYTRIISAR
jgi:hypothetical protein